MFKEILDFLDLKDIKKNKTYFITRVLISSLFALSYFLDMIITQGYKQTDSYKLINDTIPINVNPKPYDLYRIFSNVKLGSNN